MLTVAVPSWVPSSLRSVTATFTFELLGFIIATPRFFKRRLLLSTKRIPFVVRSGGSTPACVATPLPPLLRNPNVSNTTNPLAVPVVVAVTGVITA